MQSLRLLFLVLFLGMAELSLATTSSNNPVLNNASYELVFRTLLNTSGKVYSLAQGRKTSAVSNSDQVRVRVTKTGGKAKTEIVIALKSASGLTTVVQRYTFDNGNYTRTQNFTINGAQGKQVVVYLNNKSATLRFDYTLGVEEI